MRKWPLGTKNILHTSEKFHTGTRTVSVDWEITREQRKIIRDFLFDLSENEQFLFYHPKLNREFISTLMLASIQGDILYATITLQKEA